MATYCIVKGKRRQPSCCRRSTSCGLVIHLCELLGRAHLNYTDSALLFIGEAVCYAGVQSLATLVLSKTVSNTVPPPAGMDWVWTRSSTFRGLPSG